MRAGDPRAELVGEAAGAIHVLPAMAAKSNLSNLFSGCVGLPSRRRTASDVQLRTDDLVRTGREGLRPKVLHALDLPLIVFMPDWCHCCWSPKRLIARRLGIETIHERAPEL